MTGTGFTISKIVVEGAKQPDAVLELAPGLNVVAGASNTGKTYVWQLIDFMLGASNTPKDIPVARSYANALMEFSVSSGGVYTLSRALAGGDAELFDVSIDDIEPDNFKSTSLKAKHAATNPNTISTRLLAWSDLLGKKIRTDQYGKKRDLSFRDVAWLCLVDEERIITDISPALSEQYTQPTEKKSVFGLFVTGTDDSAIVQAEKPRDRKKRLDIELNFLNDLLDARQERLEATGVDPDQLAEENQRIANEIDRVSELLATRQSQLDEAVSSRDDAWSELQTSNSRQLFLSEQIKRLTLLQSHYDSDQSRLESSLEAGQVLERLPTGECPVCGYKPEEDEVAATDLRLAEFQRACVAELEKIAILARDLQSSLQAMQTERTRLQERQKDLQRTLNKANQEIEELLQSKVVDTDKQLSALLQQQAKLSEAEYAAAEIKEFQVQYSAIEKLKAQPSQQPRITGKVQAAVAVEFCQVVESILDAWKFPLADRVSWSEDNFDLIIGNENRGSMGKGYRAVTHAAFTIGLMRYCRAKDIPHPGIVVLDTPLNPYRGPDRDEKEGISMEVQEAFYKDLASHNGEDQIIIFENTEPPLSTRHQMTYTHYSGNPAAAPAGFFPASKSKK